MSHRRTLDFATYQDVIDEIERLEHAEYVMAGTWTLGQICDHLAYYLRGSVEGYPFLLPWIVRKTFGRWYLRKTLRSGRMPAGGRTIPSSVPDDEVDEAGAIAECKALLERLSNPRVRLHPSPLFGHLTWEHWRDLHLIHAAHHLSFLVRKSEADV